MNVYVPEQGKVLAHFGEDAQSIVHMEECAELIQAISKMRRARKEENDDTYAYYNLVEEMADVIICLEQMQLMYGISTCEIQTMIMKKCKRQGERILEHV